jgi:hypothetical protein
VIAASVAPLFAGMVIAGILFFVAGWIARGVTEADRRLERRDRQRQLLDTVQVSPPPS